MESSISMRQRKWKINGCMVKLTEFVPMKAKEKEKKGFNYNYNCCSKRVDALDDLEE